MKRTRQEKLRIGFVFALVCLFFAVVTARLIHLQVYLSGQYSEIVDRQTSGTVTIPASRGILYDRSGRVVVNNVTHSSLYAYPEDEAELRQVTGYVEKLFGLEEGSAKKRYGLAPRRFRWIKRKLDDVLAHRIARSAPRGLYLRKETRREYPFGLIGKQISGFTDIDNRGQSGIELSFDSILAGQQGLADIRRDGLRNLYRVNETALVRPSPGKSVVLTIDWRLQEVLEEELRKGVLDHNAESGMAAFLDCNTGEVLAMAHFDPSEENPSKPTKLRAVTDQFEPGSVFKAITAAGIIDDGLVNYEDSVFCEEGRVRIGGRILHDDKELGWLTFREILELSSNIGMAKYAIPRGGEELYETARKFGFGQKVRIGLPGETAGRLVRPPRWSDYNIAALAMGHSVAVNTLQLAVAFAAIANGGRLIRPHLVLGYVDGSGKVVDRRDREPVSRVVKKASADTLRSILRGVVETGTAEAVNSPAVSIAGKTGTAQIPDLANRRYFQDRFIGSFAGFFPYEEPLVAGVVVLEAPGPVHYGGLTAGPVFRRIAERHAVLNPDAFTAADRLLAEKSKRFHNTVEVPDLLGRELVQAEEIARKHGVKVRANDGTGVVVWQFPQPDRLAFEGNEILIALASDAGRHLKMADLTGLSIRQGTAFLHLAGINCEIAGNGKVVKQSIRPGEAISRGATCRLICRPT